MFKGSLSLLFISFIVFCSPWGVFTSLCLKLPFLFVISMSRFLGVLRWLFSLLDFFFYCSVWLHLVSFTAAFVCWCSSWNQDTKTQQWTWLITLALCGYRTACSRGVCASSEGGYCMFGREERAPANTARSTGWRGWRRRPGTMWPLMQQWEGKCVPLWHSVLDVEISFTWTKVEEGWTFCWHLPLAMSLWLVQLLAIPCEQLLLHPGYFEARDFDFQSNHVKSYHLLFLILYAIYLTLSLFNIRVWSLLHSVCVCAWGQGGSWWQQTEVTRKQMLFY